MSVYNRIPVVIPSYDPDEKLCAAVAALQAAGFTDIILIDDGSRADTKQYFPPEGAGITLLRHPENRGKGAGLKTAFRYILEHRPDAIGCVTADGDGQHRPADVTACADELIGHPDSIVLGVRDFSGPNVPARSRAGNRFTCGVFRLLFGMRISDTQTGLRAFPKDSLAGLVTVRGDRYEYETNMLLYMKQAQIPFREVPIETVYIDENATSHFRPVRDSLRVYGMILAFALSSMASFAVDLVLFLLFRYLIFPKTGLPMRFSYALSYAAARLCSATVNYLINRTVVFRDRGSRHTAWRYAVMALCILAVSATVGQAFARLIPPSLHYLETVLKLVLDALLFLCSFRLQHQWVFQHDTKPKAP